MFKVELANRKTESNAVNAEWADDDAFGHARIRILEALTFKCQSAFDDYKTMTWEAGMLLEADNFHFL